MHPYAIDSNERMVIPLYLAIVSVLVTFFFQWLFDLFNFTLPWWIKAPSVFLLYGALYKLFDIKLWKWNVFKRIGAVKTPNLNGNWSGHLISSYNKQTSYEANIRIIQNWTKISIVLTTKTSSSHSLVAGIVTENPEQNILNYQYINDPRPLSEPTMHIHIGTSILYIPSNCKNFTGEYYTGRDRENYGEMIFERKSS
jgi:hypothetical protein